MKDNRVNRLPLRIVAIAFVFMTISCATSMTPSQFLKEFPTSTNTKFYDHRSAKDAIANGKCKLIVEGRKYTSPIGLTVNGDLQNGAAGVDEWVRADGGNAYILNNFEWISVGDQGATQLLVYFDTLLCK